MTRVITIICLIVSHLTVLASSYGYRHMLCGVKHLGYSAPAWLSLLNGVPYLMITITSRAGNRR